MWANHKIVCFVCLSDCVFRCLADIIPPFLRNTPPINHARQQLFSSPKPRSASNSYDLVPIFTCDSPFFEPLFASHSPLAMLMMSATYCERSSL